MLLHKSEITLPDLVYKKEEDVSEPGNAMVDLVVSCAVGDLLERVSDKGDFCSKDQASTVLAIKEAQVVQTHDLGTFRITLDQVVRDAGTPERWRQTNLLYFEKALVKEILRRTIRDTETENMEEQVKDAVMQAFSQSYDREKVKRKEKEERKKIEELAKKGNNNSPGGDQSAAARKKEFAAWMKDHEKNSSSSTGNFVGVVNNKFKGGYTPDKEKDRKAQDQAAKEKYQVARENFDKEDQKYGIFKSLVRRKERDSLGCEYNKMGRCSFQDCQCAHLSDWLNPPSWAYIYDSRFTIRKNIEEMIKKMGLEGEAKDHYEKLLKDN